MEETLIPRPVFESLCHSKAKQREEFVQSDCEKVLKEELKEIWASTVLFAIASFDKDRALSCLKSPFARGSPVIELLVHLIAKKLGRSTPPLVLHPTCLPLFELCQLAVLWSIAGFAKEASSLAHSLFPLLDFPTLWTREEEYNALESDLSFSFFRPMRNGIDPAGAPPFFQAIGHLFSGFDVPCSIELFCPKPIFFHAPDIQGALSLLGRRTPLGTFRAKEVEIRAFGPQSLPLSSVSGFGIERSMGGEDGWTNVSACPEVWLHVTHFCESGLGIQFLGLIPGAPLNFSFYIKASKAQIESAQFLPKSLIRYQGASKPVVLNENFQIESLLPTQMELIPLAGEGCFWGTEFLLSFEIQPITSRVEFEWKLIAK